MNLSFSRALISVLFLSVILGALIAGDGRSNWYKGVQLLIVYLIIGTMSTYPDLKPAWGEKEQQHLFIYLRSECFLG
jgi:hypothetical protein